MFDHNINNSCAVHHRYSKGFDSCLYIYGEPLRITLLMCAISIFALLIILFVMLMTTKKLLPALIKEKPGTPHTFPSQPDFVEDHSTQIRNKSYAYSNIANHRSFSNNVLQL